MEDVGRKLDLIATKTNEFETKYADRIAETAARLLSVEQKLSTPNHLGGPDYDAAIGSQIVNSEGFKSLQMGARVSGQIRIGKFHKTAIINATGLNQPLVQDYRVPGIVTPAQQRLTIRDLMPSFPSPSNMVQFVRETSSTNAAAPQAGESIAKAESAMTFALINSPVQTLAHWIPASKQILDDATALRAYIDTRMLYMLKLVEENQLLNGSGSGNNILGLIAQSTPYDTNFSNTSTDTYIDTVAHAIEQVQLANYDPDAIILNPKDFWRISLSKTSGGGADGRYLYTDPAQALNPRM
jgi:HK97 family phage major capsid protein